MSKQGCLTFGWWNSSLSPCAKKRPIADRQATFDIISLLVMSYNCDFLGVTELSEDDTDLLSEIFESTNYSVFPCFDKVGKGKFNQAYIVNENRFRIRDTKIERHRMGTLNFRAAHVVLLENDVLPTPLTVFASHWPSKTRVEDDVRDGIGATLRRSIDEILDDSDDNAHIILMGDYNSEPFQSALSKHLLSIRDPNLVSRKNRLLYNPFWSKLGVSSSGKYCGSHYYKSDSINKWWLFDQIMFSHQFVNNELWTKIPEAIIVDDDPIINLILDKNTHFDHLPVLINLEYKHG